MRLFLSHFCLTGLLATVIASNGLGQDKVKLSKAPIKNRLVVVGAPKIYDDLYLRQLLSSLQSQLASTHAIDQATLLTHIGVAQGADLRQMSAAISASGPPTPQVQTFGLAPGVPAFSYPPGYSGSSTATAYPTGTATPTTPGTTTTTSSVTPAAATPPAPTLAAPAISSLGQSSLDTYNESLQLSAELTNTALLLQGALSDTLSADGNPKATVTIGFPITVESPSIDDKDLAGALAEVHVTVCSDGSESPSIVTLLPRERTYNVASLVDNSFLGSASAVMGGVVNVGGGFLWSHKRYYLVQQQETVAFLVPGKEGGCGDEPRHASFAWQIRPVLGKDFIRPGNSVNFVQIAIPEIIGNSPTRTIGKACVSVIWRKPAVTGLFRKKSEEYFDESLSSPEQCYDIDYYNTLTSKNQTLSVMDIGQGLVTVKATGTFLPGTTVRLGNTYLPPDNISATHDALKFTTLASAIVGAGQVYFVGRDGREIEAIHNETPTTPLTMKQLTISPYSDAQSLVKINFDAPPDAVPGDQGASNRNPADDPWVVVIGGKVFGMSDAPFFAKTPTEIQLIVPTALIQTSPQVELRRLLWRDVSYRRSMPILSDTFSKAAPAVSAASILSSQNGLIIGLVGTGLDKLTMVFPSKDMCPDCKSTAAGSTFLQVTLQKPTDTKKKDKKSALDPTDGLRQLAFCRKPETDKAKQCDENFPTLLVDVPKLDTPAAKPSLDKHDPVPVNTHQVTITGSMLDQVVSIEHAKASLGFRLVPGKNPSLLIDLPDAIAKVPGGYSLLVTFADKSATGYLLTVKTSGS